VVTDDPPLLSVGVVVGVAVAVLFPVPRYLDGVGCPNRTVVVSPLSGSKFEGSGSSGRSVRPSGPVWGFGPLGFSTCGVDGCVPVVGPSGGNTGPIGSGVVAPGGL